MSIQLELDFTLSYLVHAHSEFLHICHLCSTIGSPKGLIPTLHRQLIDLKNYAFLHNFISVSEFTDYSISISNALDLYLHGELYVQ